MKMRIETKSLGEVEAGVTKDNNVKYIDWSGKNEETTGKIDVEYPSGEQLFLRSEKEPESTELWAFFGWRGYVRDINQASIESDNLIRLEKSTIYKTEELNGWATPKGGGDGYESETFGDFVANSWAVGVVDLVFATSDGQPLYTSNNVPLSATMEMRYEGWREEAHTGIMEELSLSQQADVTSPVEGAGSISDRLEEAKADDLGSESLRRFLAIEPELKDFIGLLRNIIRRPAERVAIEEKRMQASASGNINDNTTVTGIENIKNKNNTVYPDRVRAKSKQVEYNIDENIFARKSNLSLLKVIRSVYEDFKRYLDAKKEKKKEYEDRWKSDKYEEYDIHWKIINEEVNECINRISEIKEYLRTSETIEDSFRKMGVERRMNRRTSTEWSSRKYKDIEKFYQNMKSILECLDVEEAERYYRSRPFSDTYEIWCFKKVQEALEGYEKLEKRGGKEKGHLYRNPEEDSIYCNFKHVDYEFLTVDLWYDKRFDHHTMDSAVYGLHGSKRNSTKHKPDIVIEFRHSNFNNGVAPSFVTLDPITSKSNPEDHKGNVPKLLEKTHYSSNIRVLEDIAGMKDKSVVDAAWALHPGYSNNTPIFQNKGDSLREGFLVMHPERDISYAQEKIIDIIEERVISQM